MALITFLLVSMEKPTADYADSNHKRPICPPRRSAGEGGLAKAGSVRLLAKAFGVDGVNDFLAGKHKGPFGGVLCLSPRRRSAQSGIRHCGC